MAVDLRKRAEELLSRNPEEVPVVSTADVQKLFHELDVHQIELQMQNEELRKAQVELAATRDSYLELYEFAPLGYLTLDLDSRIIEANFSAASQLGVERGKLLGKTVAGFVHRDSIELWNRYLRDVLEDEEKKERDLILQRPDGAVFHAHLVCTPRMNAEHQIDRLLVALVDISSRVQAEEALRKSEEELARTNRELEKRIEERTEALSESESRFRTLFEEMPDACFELCPEGRFIDGNKAVEQQIGYQWEELSGQSIFESDIFPPQARLIAAERLKLLLQGEQVGPVEYELRRKDGAEITVEVSTMLIRLQGKKVLLCSSRDLTARKKAEEALRKSEAEFRSTLNDLPVAVVVHAADTSILISNPQASLILGISQEEILGKKADDPAWHFVNEDLSVMQPEDYPVNRVLRTGEKVLNQTIGVSSPDRKELTWILLNAVPIFTEQNELSRIVSNFTDISENRRMQEALEKRVLALTQPLDEPEAISFDDLFDLNKIQRMQDEFAAATGVASIITHPDGTPITNPSNFSDLCGTFVRQTEKGLSNCLKSDALIGRGNPDGPTVEPCMSCGLWSAGAGITIGGRHIANWVIGQVRNERQTDDQMRNYAREIGVDETAFLKAFHRIPIMKLDRFKEIAQALFTLASQLSISAYQNVQQARFIANQKKSERKIKENEEKYRLLFEMETDAIMIFDSETSKMMDVNNAAVQLYGYTHVEFLKLSLSDITAEPEATSVSLKQINAGERPFIPFRRHRKKDGTIFFVEIATFRYSLKGQQVACEVVRDITERVVRDEELHKNRQELRKLAAELSLAEQRERERIGQELHDGISQLLSSSYLRLSVLKESPLPEPAVEALGTICDILQDTLQQTRSLTFELSCPMLNELGLAAALEELCSSMTQEESVHFEFEGNTEEELPLPMDRKIVLYRAVRELLINVLKHSEAKSAVVKIDRVDHRVRICVEDDGRGFDARRSGKGFSTTGGFGLFNLREYLQHAGGSLRIESMLGRGTKAILTVELEDEHE